MKNQKEIYKIIDANLNRAREGVRVVEELFRFIKKSKRQSDQLKELRHKITRVGQKLPISLEEVKLTRKVAEDVGRRSFTKSEKSKENLTEMVLANLQRAQEALRVLEEFSKLVDVKASYQFKKLRFQSYEIEYKILKAL